MPAKKAADAIGIKYVNMPLQKIRIENWRREKKQ
jgi:hypothetical protein